VNLSEDELEIKRRDIVNRSCLLEGNRFQWQWYLTSL